MHHWLKTLNKYNIASKGTIPAEESFSFWNTGKWSGVAAMSQGRPTNMAVLIMASCSC